MKYPNKYRLGRFFTAGVPGEFIWLCALGGGKWRICNLHLLFTPRLPPFDSFRINMEQGADQVNLKRAPLCGKLQIHK